MKPNLEKSYSEFIEIYKKSHPLITKQACQSAYDDKWTNHEGALMDENGLEFKRMIQVYFLANIVVVSISYLLLILFGNYSPIRREVKSQKE